MLSTPLEAGKLALKQFVQTKKEDGETTELLQEGKMLLVDGQMVVQGSGDSAGAMMVTLGTDGTIIRGKIGDNFASFNFCTFSPKRLLSAIVVQ